MKIAIIDIETTGLDPLKHEIIDIGAVIFDDQSMKSKEFSFLVKPEHPETGSKEAYRINGYDKELWEDAKSLKEAMILLSKEVNDAVFCAHNMIFDWSFLQEASKNTGIDLGFSHRKVDLFSVAWAKINHHTMDGWSLKKICERLLIEPEPAIHTGINGAKVEFEVYKKLML